MLAGLHKPTELIVVTLLSYGCPFQAIVRAYGFTAGATPQSGTGPDHQLMGGICRRYDFGRYLLC